MTRIDRRQFVSAALAGSALAAVGAGARAAGALPRYRITDLGDLGGSVIQVRALNNHGTATGMATRHDGDHKGVAFVAAHGRMRGMRFLGPGQPSEGTAINNLGIVAGYDRGTIVPGSPWQAWYAARDGVRHYITPLAGGQYNQAFGINDAGAIVGHSEWMPFVYIDGQTLPLGRPRGYSQGEARAINEAGDIVGGLAGNAGWHAFVHFDGVMQPLEIPGVLEHRATGVNRHRQVCGSLHYTDALPGRAFIWQDGVAHELGSLGDETTPSRALGLNDAGIVVGGSARRFNGTLYQRAFIATKGVMHDLNDFVDPADAAWMLKVATAINRHGQIVGQGRFNGVERAFLATPVEA